MIILKSNHIYTNSLDQEFSGYIIINNGKIESLIAESDFDLQKLKISQDKIIDYTDSYIFPGLIDLNVHLCSTYDEEWSDVENTTKMALQGGITTIIDSPILNKYDSKFDEEKSILNRIDELNSNIYCDVGLLAYLGPHNYQNLLNLWSIPEVFGFKFYISCTPQHDLPHFSYSQQAMIKLLNYIQKTELKGAFFCVNPEKTTLRDVFLCSPFRSKPKEQRINLEEDLKDLDKFGGGIQGEEPNSSKSDLSDDEEEKNDEIGDLNIYKNEMNNFHHEINSAILKYRSQNAAKIQEQRAIHYLELLEYGNNDKEEKNFEMKQLEESDSDLNSNKPESSDSDEEESKIKRKELMAKKKSKFSIKKPLSPQKCLNDPEVCLKPDMNKLFKDKFRGAIQTLKSDGALTPSEKESLSPESPLKQRKPSSLLIRRMSIKGNMGSELSVDQIKQENEKSQEKERNSSYKIFLSLHYISWESTGTQAIINVFKNLKDNKLLICNISSTSVAFEVRKERKKNPDFNIFCEGCLPYLYFYSEMIKNGQTKFKGCPPIRDKEERNISIIGLILNDLYHCISSYHLQVPYNYKSIDNGNFKRCFNGFSIIGFNLQVVWTKLFSIEKKRFKISGNQNEYNENIKTILKFVLYYLCENPAKLIGIHNRKGSIEVGKEADLVIWNPFEIEVINRNKIFIRNKKSYLLKNYKVYGKVKATYLRGTCVYNYDKEEFLKAGLVMSKNLQSKI